MHIGPSRPEADATVGDAVGVAEQRGHQGPARNRVTPHGLIVASPGRGTWMGNRGRLHVGEGARDVVRNHQSRAWITCRLEYKGWRVEQWHPRHYTPLFFLDEAVSLAAGHRPCALCRRQDFTAFSRVWAHIRGLDHVSAPEIDAELHRQRHASPAAPAALHVRGWVDLPDGAFVIVDDRPAVVRGEQLQVYDPRTNAYGATLARPRGGSVPVLTPAATVEVLRSGYLPHIDSPGPG